MHPVEALGEGLSGPCRPDQRCVKWLPASYNREILLMKYPSSKRTCCARMCQEHRRVNRPRKWLPSQQRGYDRKIIAPREKKTGTPQVDLLNVLFRWFVHFLRMTETLFRCQISHSDVMDITISPRPKFIDTMQIWMWLNGSNWCIYKFINVPNGEI